MIEFLKGKQVILRGASVTDASDEYLSWINDAETTRGLVSGLFPSTMEELKTYLEESTRNKDSIMFAICDVNSGRHIGNIKLDQFDWVSRTCELGILIGDANSRGKGIGKEVCRLVLEYAFDQLNIRKVFLAVFANNPGAKKLYENLGFQEEGCLRKHVWREGQYMDLHQMGIFKDELK